MKRHLNAQRNRLRSLTKPQRAFLGLLADGARRRLIQHGAIDAHDESADDWRRREAREATKDLDPQGHGWKISEAPAHAFDALKAHFEVLSGKSREALDTLTGPSNDTRQLTHLIDVQTKACGVTAGYVQGICKRMFGGRTTWQTAHEGKAVLAALKQAARRKRQSAEALAAAAVV